LALTLVGCLTAAGLFAISTSAQGTQSTVNLCITKAGPDKGSVRFVQAKQKCKGGELRVQVVGSTGEQGAFGAQESSDEAGPPDLAVPAGVAGYVRVEGTSARGAGSGSTPETASAAVSCPEGRNVVGGGYQVNAGPVIAGNNPAAVAVTQNRATSDTMWSVSAITDDKSDVGPWTVTAYAICADLSS
jgi:hypothetical protein